MSGLSFGSLRVFGSLGGSKGAFADKCPLSVLTHRLERDTIRVNNKKGVGGRVPSLRGWHVMTVTPGNAQNVVIRPLAVVSTLQELFSSLESAVYQGLSSLPGEDIHGGLWQRVHEQLNALEEALIGESKRVPQEIIPRRH